LRGVVGVVGMDMRRGEVMVREVMMHTTDGQTDRQTDRAEQRFLFRERCE
jgi:hypothetical protein